MDTYTELSLFSGYGGFSLGRPADRLTVLDVVNVFEPNFRICNCPLGLGSHTRLCSLYRRLDEATTLIEGVFAHTSIADLLAEDPDNRPLCERRSGLGSPENRDPVERGENYWNE